MTLTKAEKQQEQKIKYKLSRDYPQCKEQFSFALRFIYNSIEFAQSKKLPCFCIVTNDEAGFHPETIKAVQKVLKGRVFKFSVAVVMLPQGVCLNPTNPVEGLKEVFCNGSYRRLLLQLNGDRVN